MAGTRARRSFGREGELIALKFLAEKGYKILEQNFRLGRLGEIDIVARDGEVLCFVEVKARTGFAYGTPGEAVGKSKQEKLRQLAEMYTVLKNMVDTPVRFDVVEVLFPGKGRSFSEGVTVNLIRNAF